MECILYRERHLNFLRRTFFLLAIFHLNKLPWVLTWQEIARKIFRDVIVFAIGASYTWEIWLVTKNSMRLLRGALQTGL